MGRRAQADAQGPPRSEAWIGFLFMRVIVAPARKSAQLISPFKPLRVY